MVAAKQENTSTLTSRMPRSRCSISEADASQVVRRITRAGRRQLRARGPFAPDFRRPGQQVRAHDIKDYRDPDFWMDLILRILYRECRACEPSGAGEFRQVRREGSNLADTGLIPDPFRGFQEG